MGDGARRKFKVRLIREPGTTVLPCFDYSASLARNMLSAATDAFRMLRPR